MSFGEGRWKVRGWLVLLIKGGINNKNLGAVRIIFKLK